VKEDMGVMEIKKLYGSIASKWGKRSAENLTTFIEHKTRLEMENKSQTLATKDDLHKVEIKLELKISELKIEMGKMKFDLIKWIITLWIAQTIMMFTLK
jgi:hypothetical protein